MPVNKRRRLFLDIETSPNIGLFWNPGSRVSISYDNIIKERAIVCIAYKWAGEKKVHFVQWDKQQNDKAMLEKIVPVMNSADEIVAHNGNKFDITWIRTRCLFHGIPMMPHYNSVDTLTLAKKKFRFNSNRLDYITKFLGLKSKKETNFQLWKDVTVDNSSKALKKMVDYCKNDVVILEKTWDKINNYVPAASSTAEYASQCPECGSEETVVNQRRTTAAGYNKVTFRCRNCGKYSTIAASRFDKDKLKRGKIIIDGF